MTCIRYITDRLISGLAMLLPVLVMSCTAVEYTGDPIADADSAESQDKSDMSEVSFEILWPEDMVTDDIPQYVMVLMNRIQNTTVHYAFKLDGNGNVMDSFEKEKQDSEPEVPLVHNGQYSIAALAASDPDDFAVPELEAYQESVDHMMKDVFVTVPQLTVEDRVSQDYIDFNPMYPYIRNVGPFWYVRPSNETHTFISSLVGKDNIVHLDPRPLTRRISFSVDIDVEDGVDVSRCVGIISGVPQKVQLMTGAVDDGNTGKMPFEMVRTTGNTYHGFIDAFGLFPSDEENLTVGPGVLTIIIHAEVEIEGVEKRRIFYKSIPVSDKISDAEIMRQDDAGGYVFTEADSYAIKVDKVLGLTMEMVISGVTDGYEEWHGYEGDAEDNPGINPEL